MTMKKQQQPPVPVKEQPVSAAPVETISGQAHLLKGNALLPLPPELSGMKWVERKFKTIKEVEQLVLRNSKVLFGYDTVLIPFPKKSRDTVETDFTPLALLLDVTRIDKPRLYVLDIMFLKHGFFITTFTKMNEFLAFLIDQASKEKLYELLAKDKAVNTLLGAKMSKGDITRFLTGVCIGDPYLLLLTDNDEAPKFAFLDSYRGPWQKVKPMLLKKYVSKGKIIVSMLPPFGSLLSSSNSEKKNMKERPPVSEAYHFEKTAPELKEVYEKIKAELLKVNGGLHFNPQRYYISVKNGRGLAFFHFSRKSISLVVMNPEKETRAKIKHHVIKTLTEKVQKFWNGACCTIVIENSKNLNEVLYLLKALVKK